MIEKYVIMNMGWKIKMESNHKEDLNLGGRILLRRIID
jgi:hypothetical protein